MIPALTRVRRAVLSSLFHTGVHRRLERYARGSGAIFTLHHVRPSMPRSDFAPNRILEVTPEFLDETIRLVKRLGYRTVTLDECLRRLAEGDSEEPFVSFTLDDGYQDNYTHAFPLFRKHRVPFTIYVCPGLLDGTARQWWRDLEEIVAGRDRLAVELEGGSTEFDCRTSRTKRQTFEAIYWALRRMPHARQMQTLADLVERHPPRTSSSPPMLTRPMIAEMMDSGLLTLGAHTMTHPALSKLPRDVVIAEMETSRERILGDLGEVPVHFSYPYGDASSAGLREFDAARELGFRTGVTTRKGVLFPDHADFPHALPRVSLNGDYQRSEFVDVFLSGVPFLLDPSLRRVDVT